MEPTRIEFQYFYDNQRRPRMTVCYLDFPMDDAHPQGWTAVGIALCSLKDMPCKKRGRAIAKARAEYCTKEGVGFGLPISRKEALTIVERADIDTIVRVKAIQYPSDHFRFGRFIRSLT